MPKMSEALPETKPVKMMVIGDSGTGKTGALFSLLEAGYKLKIIDHDNGVDILAQIAKAKGKMELLENVEYVTLTDKWKAAGTRMIPMGAPKAWANALKLLSTGKLDDEDWGKPETWGTDTVLVYDSLTKGGEAAMLNVLQANSRLMEMPYQSDWGEAQRIIMGLVNHLASTEIKCHLIVNTHVKFVELSEGMVRGYPSSVGKALSTELPRSFNIILNAYTKGTGKSARKLISALPQGIVETKPGMLPKGIPESWPQETALAEFFKLYGATPK